MSEVMAGILGRLGLGDLRTWAAIRDGWGEIAGPPWDTLSVPVSLHDGVLVVEVVQPGALGMLRYGRSNLERRLAEQLGEGIVDEVRLRAAAGR